MIEFGSIDGELQSSVAPENMQVALVVERAAHELDRVSLLVRELEDTLITARNTATGADTVVAQQSVDMVQQSVDVLSDFLKNLAVQCGSWDVPVATPLAQVSLGAMRERLIQGDETSNSFGQVS